jgi:hypothetical protein
MAEAKTKSTTPPPALVRHEDHEVTAHLNRLSLYAQGIQDGICLALGERTVDEIRSREEHEAPEYRKQYMDGVLTGVAYVGKQSQWPPTDNSTERWVGHFLYRVMRRRPKGIWDKHENYRDKDELQEYCFKKFKIGPRAYERLRSWAVYRAAAAAFYKRGPRGRHRSERVQHLR